MNVNEYSTLGKVIYYGIYKLYENAKQGDKASCTVLWFITGDKT